MADNLFLSYELMYLLNWLLKNDKTKLKTLIKSALEAGLASQLSNFRKTDNSMEDKQINADLQNTFVEFLYFVEQELINNLETMENQDVFQEDLVSSLKQLNIKNIDLETMWTSMQQAKSVLNKKNIKNDKEEDTPEQIKNVLLEKVLKNWKPTKSDPVN